MADNNTMHRTPTAHSQQSNRRSQSPTTRGSAASDNAPQGCPGQFSDNTAVLMNGDELRQDSEPVTQKMNKEGIQTNVEEIGDDSVPNSPGTEPNANEAPVRDLERGPESATRRTECAEDSKLVIFYHLCLLLTLQTDVPD